MGEGVFDRFVRRPQAARKESQAEPKKGMTRRTLFRKGRRVAKVAAYATVEGAALGLLGYAGLTKTGEFIGGRVTQETRRKYEQSLDQAKVMAYGDVLVNPGGIIRDSTRHDDFNLVDKGSLIGVNGHSIDPKAPFRVGNLPQVTGGSPEGYFGGGDWLMAIGTFKNPFAVWKQLIYFPTGAEAERGGIVPDRDHGTRFYPIKTKSEKGFTLDNGTKDGLFVPRSEIGQVKQP